MNPLENTHTYHKTENRTIEKNSKNTSLKLQNGFPAIGNPRGILNVSKSMCQQILSNTVYRIKIGRKFFQKNRSKESPLTQGFESL